MTEPIDGVIKFEARHAQRSLRRDRYAAACAELAAWREILVGLEQVGQDPARYEGAGFGNVSVRVAPFPGARGARAFLISGTQTGGRRCVSLSDFCAVSRYDARSNSVESHGDILPSSEALTHGAIYDLGPHIRAVLHAHAPVVYRAAAALGVPTSRAVPYGTPEMAAEIARLYRESSLEVTQVLTMGGHEDGVIAFGRSLEEAGAKLLGLTARAYALAFANLGQLCSS